MFRDTKKRLNQQLIYWWKSLWHSRMKAFFGQEIYHQAQTEIRKQRPTFRLEGQGYRCRVKQGDKTYQIRIAPPAFDEAAWQPLLDEIAHEPRLFTELLDNRGDDLETVFKGQGGEALIDRALEMIDCKCNVPRCVHRAKALLVVEQMINQSVQSFCAFCGCSYIDLVNEMYKRGIDMQGNYEGVEVLIWRERQRDMLNRFWEGTGKLQLPEINRTRAEVPPLPLEMDIFMGNLRLALSKSPQKPNEDPFDSA